MRIQRERERKKVRRIARKSKKRAETKQIVFNSDGTYRPPSASGSSSSTFLINFCQRDSLSFCSVGLRDSARVVLKNACFVKLISRTRLKLDTMARLTIYQESVLLFGQHAPDVLVEGVDALQLESVCIQQRVQRRSGIDVALVRGRRALEPGLDLELWQSANSRRARRCHALARSGRDVGRRRWRAHGAIIRVRFLQRRA
ncbi:hypothetical protein BOTBODRAFT_570855 [Botryobasidium botryosum FD-172 SS1]|uniref:Uncharacterized protein n=1 Tax=Botryobasidium botryosum (strain FD-172 SS1) TaxID=930990 RepID=A0A067M8S2_BOTB1|nr:hypothetical protein BOTBODRAFT_570855 [Botryobasidium botryosum FD-172 SS1]